MHAFKKYNSFILNYLHMYVNAYVRWMGRCINNYMHKYVNAY